MKSHFALTLRKVNSQNIISVSSMCELLELNHIFSPENVEYILMYTTTITDDPSIDSNDLVAIETLNNGSRAVRFVIIDFCFFSNRSLSSFIFATDF